MGKRPLAKDMIPKRKEVAKRLEEMRANMNMTKIEFADLIGISDQYYGTLAKGDNFLATDKLIRLAAKSNVSLDYLLLGKQSNNDEINCIFERLSPDEVREMIDVMKSIYRIKTNVGSASVPTAPKAN